VAPEAKDELIAILEKNGLAGFTTPLGQLKAKGEKAVLILP
jgi:hypothetical protein